MFCPRCGQQQASEEVRFCSRCGLHLDALAEFVESGGRLASRDASEDLPALTPRQRGTRMGLLILVAGLIFGVLAVILTAFKEDFFPFLILAAFILTSASCACSTACFSKTTRRAKRPPGVPPATKSAKRRAR